MFDVIQCKYDGSRRVCGRLPSSMVGGRGVCRFRCCLLVWTFVHMCVCVCVSVYNIDACMIYDMPYAYANLYTQYTI